MNTGELAIAILEVIAKGIDAYRAAKAQSQPVDPHKVIEGIEADIKALADGTDANNALIDAEEKKLFDTGGPQP